MVQACMPCCSEAAGRRRGHGDGRRRGMEMPKLMALLDRAESQSLWHFQKRELARRFQPATLASGARAATLAGSAFLCGKEKPRAMTLLKGSDYEIILLQVHFVLWFSDKARIVILALEAAVS